MNIVVGITTKCWFPDGIQPLSGRVVGTGSGTRYTDTCSAMWKKRATVSLVHASRLSGLNIHTDAKLQGTRTLTERKWDAVVVGAGHNGLTAAAYLAKAGLKVAVLERRHVIGGAAVTEELIPGFKFSRCSYLQSLLRPCIVRELELSRHGLKLLKRNPSSFTPCLDGRYLLLGPDEALNYSEISKFSRRDAIAYPRYEEQLQNFVRLMEHLLDSTPPELRRDVPTFVDHMTDKLKKSLFWCHFLKKVFKLGYGDAVDFVNLLVSPASRVLNNWFEVTGDVLKATLATDAVIGSMSSVCTPGSGYVLLHHVMGESDGDRGVWSYVEGGMGSISMAIGRAACEAGAHIVTNAEVILADGSHVHTSSVLSNATPHVTFMKLVPEGILPEEFLHGINSIDYSSDIDRAHRDALNGLPSQRPLIEMTIPSVLDKTISPPGKHVVNLFIQYTPYKPTDGCWQDLSFRDSFAQRCFSLIDEYAPGFSSSIIGYDMLAPPDLEKQFYLTGLTIDHLCEGFICVEVEHTQGVG
ncbi:Pyridine nucleotide-disulfide oxidoreductase domain-containing protein 2 [Nymphaea thermarum]|nr:Pyridine nucleotide-disulfide oxidoreductase domain-containing protein 2 [Nymphaea thermarum]